MEVGDATAVANFELSADLIELILLKLPSESLIRFRCVSKEWNIKISSNNFIHRHWCYKPHDSGLIVIRSSSTISDYFALLSLSHSSDGSLVSNSYKSFRLPFISIDSEPFLFHAGFGVYGLFCLRYGDVALWNPSIQHVTNIPPSPFGPGYNNRLYENGLANVSYEDDIFTYKVALLRHRYYSRFVVFTMDLYSSTDGSWKRFSDFHSTKKRFDTSVNIFYRGTNLNNSFHWFSWLDRKDPHIVTFDMKTEEFGRIEVPSFLKGNPKYEINCSGFTKFNGKYLCLLLKRLKDESVYLEAWIMREYGNHKSWTKKSTGPISTICKTWSAMLLGATSDGVLFDIADNGIGLFFCRYGSTKVDTLLPVESYKFEFFRVEEYKNSLLSFNGRWDERTRNIR